MKNGKIRIVCSCLLLVLFCSILSSCNEEHINDNLTNDLPISFDVKQKDIATRVLDGNNNEIQVIGYLYNDKASLDTESYLGFYSSNTYIPVDILFNGTTWDYKNKSDIVYWPDVAMNFYATTNLDFSKVQIKDNKNNICSYNFNIPTDITKQKDVMVANSFNVTKETNNGKVKFNFFHYLDKIIFKGYIADPSYDIEVKDIIVHNACDSAAYVPQLRRFLGKMSDSIRVFSGQFTHVNNFPLGIASPIKITAMDEKSAISLGNHPLYLPSGAVRNSWEDAESLSEADKNKHCYLEIVYRFKINGEQVIPATGDGYGSTYVPFSYNYNDGNAHQITVYLKLSGGYDDNHKPIINTKSPINFNISVEDWTSEKIDFKSFKKP